MAVFVGQGVSLQRHERSSEFHGAQDAPAADGEEGRKGCLAVAREQWSRFYIFWRRVVMLVYWQSTRRSDPHLLPAPILSETLSAAASPPPVPVHILMFI
jgi:hypothetical protein